MFFDSMVLMFEPGTAGSAQLKSINLMAVRRLVGTMPTLQSKASSRDVGIAPTV